MENYYLPEINSIGQNYVEKWLKDNGYFDISRELLQAKDSGFNAKGKSENLLIQVRTFLYPQRPFKLSDFEINALTGKAVKLGLVAYAAYVTLDAENNLSGEILWERLN